MQEINGRLEGRQVLASDVTFRGMLDGDLVVPGGTTLILHGTVNGDVIVDVGGVAEVRGSVKGTVYNNGGSVLIYGRVGMVAGTHPSKIDPNAAVEKTSF